MKNFAIWICTSLIVVSCQSEKENQEVDLQFASIGTHMIKSGIDIEPHPAITFDTQLKNGFFEVQADSVHWGYQFYYNGKKHGPYYDERGLAFLFGDSTSGPVDGWYVNDVKQGQFNTFTPWGDTREIVCFENGDTLWTSSYFYRWKSFPYRYLVKTYEPDQFVQVKSPKGHIWYEGEFKDNDPEGIHKIYREDSTTVAHFNYDNWTYARYDNDNEPLEEQQLTSSWSVWIGR